MNHDLFMPTGKSLHKVVVGQSGSGKSVFLEESARAFLKSNSSETMRLVYFSPKQEGFIDLLPQDKKKRPIGLVGSVDGMLKNLEKNVLTVFYPDSYELESTMDETLDALFDFKDANPTFKCTIVIDDSQVFLSSRKQASESFRRIALLGRSRELNVIFVSHAVVLNKTLEGQVDTLIFFSLPAKAHWKQTEERYGFNPEPMIEQLRSVPYSFVYYDVRSMKASMMNPIPLE